MYLYITLDEAVSREDGINLINEKINSNIYNIEFIGSYNSRDYETLIFKTDIEEDQFNNIKSIIKDQKYILQVDKYMKYYYTFTRTKDSFYINNHIKEILKDSGYELKLSRSHSKNGVLFMLLKIFNINPLNDQELTRIEDTVKSIEGIDTIIKY